MNSPDSDSRLAPKTIPLRIVVCFVLALCTVTAFWPVRQIEFLDYDDPEYVTANPVVQQGLTMEGIKWALTTGHATNWHPMTWLSHMLDCQLFGPNPAGHHLMNLFFHVCAAVLLFLLLEKMTSALWRSALVAALFALHPLHVQSVAWVAERKDVLSGFFWMLTLWSYFGYVRAPNMRRYLVTVVFLALGLMSKPTVVTLPFVLLLLDIWPLRRVDFNQSKDFKSVIQSLRPLVLEKLPFFGLVLLGSVATYLAQSKGGAILAGDSLPLGSRLANALVSYVRYLGKTFWPEDLSIFYPHPGTWGTWRVAMAGLLIAVISILAVRTARSRPALFVGWCWFLGTLVPAIGLVQVGVHSIADRYTYLPLIGVFIVLAWSLPELIFKRFEKPLLAAMLAVTGICLVAVRIELKHWRNTETLFRHCLAVTRNNYVAGDILGHWLIQQGRYPEAIEVLTDSVRLNPREHLTQNHLAFALERSGRAREAAEHYAESLRAIPNQADIHRRLANILGDLGNAAESNKHFRESLRLNPNDPETYNEFGVNLVAEQKLGEAIGCFKQALRLDPKNPRAAANLKQALAAQTNSTNQSQPSQRLPE